MSRFMSAAYEIESTTVSCNAGVTRSTGLPSKFILEELGQQKAHSAVHVHRLPVMLLS